MVTISWCGAPRSRRSGGSEAKKRWIGVGCTATSSIVELVPERPVPFHHGHVLRHPGEFSAVSRIREAARKQRGELADVGAEHRHEPAREHRLQ